MDVSFKCGFEMTVEKTETKVITFLLWAIITGTDSAMNQSKFLAITWNLLKAHQKLPIQSAIGFGFASNSNWKTGARLLNYSLTTAIIIA